MLDFGKLLRDFRRKCVDQGNSGRTLSQERLGELLGEEMNMRPGYTGAAVSDWERGKSKIHADQRLVLVSLIKIFSRLGAIKTLSEANQFLEAGNYRALDPTELLKLSFEEPPNSRSKISEHQSKDSQRFPLLVMERLLFLSDDEFRALVNEAKEGPIPKA